MTAKMITSLCLLGVALTSGSVRAGTFDFTNAEGDNRWVNENNWINQAATGKPGIPGAADEARVRASTARITTEVTVGYLKCGVSGPGTVLIDGGSLIAVGTREYNAANYNSTGSVIIQNGGSASFSNYFMVGFAKYAGGSVVISEGTLRVANTYYHSKDYYSETEAPLARTTVKTGGLLDVYGMRLNAGVMDIAGGTVIVRRDVINDVEQWVADGRMIAMGGSAEWKIKATFDGTTGWTTIIAVPASEPVTVGMHDPVVFVQVPASS